ncbi:hypothetical protein [Cyclobacterium qasimii]|uniref:DUF3575 domain-containing protein n=2 Tax=Cyclobacterium qasimii TaxID=1350429 RepID=S7VNM5_9BACT|nr:hypothetical protein [Cyclobacterium qasimii]EPR71576.1 hypothetical protein ADICYQ_0244 [Cyclobacterium qasimii M12-11B]GEO20282.1 hypothetical protein CQA01_08160 [Cyclobacterium qasimii]
MKRNTILPFLLLFVLQFAWFSALAQDEPSYKNRIGINVLGIPSQNLVASYEYSFMKNGLWLGIEHKLNQLSDDKDQQVNSLALEYRYYLFAKDKVADGLFAGLYTKYRWGEESTTTGASILHEYQAIFTGLNAGYRYNYKRLALSAFVGYGLPLWTTASTIPNGASHELNENYKKDLRLGLTVGLAF